MTKAILIILALYLITLAIIAWPLKDAGRIYQGYDVIIDCITDIDCGCIDDCQSTE